MRARVGWQAGRGDARQTRCSARVLGILCAAGALLLTCGSPAMALSQRGHVFGFTFGGKGTAEGQFSGPTGVAVGEVNKSSDNVYVIDAPADRVECAKALTPGRRGRSALRAV